MLDLYAWILFHFEKGSFKCPFCSAQFQKSGMVVFGIKLSSQIDPHKSVLYIEYCCPDCNKKSGFEIAEMSMEDLSFQIISDLEIEDEINQKHSFKPKVNKDPKKKARQRKTSPKNTKLSKEKSKITHKDQKEVAGVLSDVSSWEDILHIFGINKNNDNGEYRIHE